MVVLGVMMGLALVRRVSGEVGGAVLVVAAVAKVAVGVGDFRPVSLLSSSSVSLIFFGLFS